MSKTYVVIDAQGGKIGQEIIKSIKQNNSENYVIAVGTNSIATSMMYKANPDVAVTGENAVIVSCRKADVIVGTIGIVVADSMMGEITPKMATAVGQANAKKILLPYNKCDIMIAGVSDISLTALLEDLRKLL